MTFKRIQLTSFACLLIPASAAARRRKPELFTYDELVQLYEQETLPGALQGKLRRLLTTPFVSNAASARGTKPLLPSTAELRKLVRVAEWNIERGLEFDAVRLAFTDAAGFSRLINSKEYPRVSQKRKGILRQVQHLRQADVVVLNEVDFGMRRTDYRDVAADLAATLGMNYAYGVEFVEGDPIALGLEKFEELPPEEAAQLVSEISAVRTTRWLTRTSAATRASSRPTRWRAPSPSSASSNSTGSSSARAHGRRRRRSAARLRPALRAHAQESQRGVGGSHLRPRAHHGGLAARRAETR